ncbi:MAG TPA: hypothetical protein VMQ83_13215, partial [Gammaproteobacteria bacterium]|nr:hypothetical protein [Gammaproteobacteria bacterium]
MMQASPLEKRRFREDRDRKNRLLINDFWVTILYVSTAYWSPEMLRQEHRELNAEGFARQARAA